MQAGMQPLTGTTDDSHMDEDLAVFHDKFELASETMQMLENIGDERAREARDGL
jgi:hypothetical protein